MQCQVDLAISVMQMCLHPVKADMTVMAVIVNDKGDGLHIETEASMGILADVTRMHSVKTKSLVSTTYQQEEA